MKKLKSLTKDLKFIIPPNKYDMRKKLEPKYSRNMNQTTYNTLQDGNKERTINLSLGTVKFATKQSESCAKKQK